MRTLAFLLLAASVAPLLTSCVNTEKYEERRHKRNAAYYEKQDRRAMRAYHRDDRYDAWVDSVLN